MPVHVSYPGVYIQEADSGVRAITGVATSITAFVGRASRGPENKPVTVNSFAEMVRVFGGLWSKSRLAFSVRDFFLNGGSQAVVLRLFQPDPALPSIAKFSVRTEIVLVAAGPGSWGNGLQAVVDHNTRAHDPSLGETPTSLFNLTVRDSTTGLIEVFRNVSLEAANGRYLPLVLKKESTLVEVFSNTATQPSISPPPPAGVSPFDNAANFEGVLPGALASDGLPLTAAPFLDETLPKKGLAALDDVDLFNLLVIPPHQGTDEFGNPNEVDTTVITRAANQCDRRRAFLLLDAPPVWRGAGVQISTIAATNFQASLGASTANAAVFYPPVVQPNPLRGNQLQTASSIGAIAGMYARTDAERGVWKAPAGLSAGLAGVPALDRTLTDPENGQLNPVGINCLRIMPGAGPVVWGARTLQGADSLASQWKYVPIRRFALFLEETLYRNLRWVVFEPNDEPLWGQIRLNITAFMQGLFRSGAFQGSKPTEAYLVKCDRETTTQADIDTGIVNIIVGFAPLRPAEFVVITLQQLAGQAAS